MEIQTTNYDNMKSSQAFRMDSEILSAARLWIRRALTSVLEGDTTFYNQLLEELKSVEAGDPDKEKTFLMTLQALSQAVSSINEHHHGSLLSWILGMSFWNFNSEVADGLMEFIVNLAASNGAFVDRCLDMLVRNFLPPSCLLPLFLDCLTSKMMLVNKMEQILQKKTEHLARKKEVLDRVHLAIQQIAEIVPTAALRLQPIIIRRMPHRYLALEWNALYIENMLRIENSAIGEIIGSRMLMAVVDRLIEIDVEIRWEDIGHDDLSKVYIFDMEMDDDYETEHSGAPHKEKLGDVADKMDVLMELTLEHLKVCAEEGRLQQVYDTLMHSFQTTILNTHKSKFTQFLIFYLCSLAPETCGAQFASMLCNVFVSSRAPNTRMTAAAYLASFLSRAKYLPLSVVSSSIKRLVDWSLQYVSNDDRKTMNPKVHRVFYSACQAIMYILCFRMNLLLDDPKQRLLIENLPLKNLLDNNLNPVKVCLPSVVQEFSRQSQAMHVFESLNISITKETLESESSKSFGGVERLDMFFPFDPYLLKRSDRFIRPDFTFWTMVQVPIDEDCDNIEVDGSEDEMLDDDADSYIDDSDREFDNQDVVEYLSVNDFQDAQSDDEEMDAFELSMNRMSITPKKSFLRSMPAMLLPNMKELSKCN